ncbi:MAG: hypothetical protein WAW90_01320 [Minisyncoccia bacterium]
MKISSEALQAYFDTPLPSVAVLADAFTFHSFEIDSIEGDVLDVKVLPNRAADCNTEEGLARELSAILGLPLKDAREPDYSGVSTILATLARINAVLGANFSQDEVLDVFGRLQFRVKIEGETFHIEAPSSRKDIALLEDIAEEVGRMIGYERVPETPLPAYDGFVGQSRYRGVEKVKDQLVEQGFIEISTQSFAKLGDMVLANPLDKSMPALRTNLDENMKTALERAKQYAPLMLAPDQKLKLFEIGTIFTKDGERLEIKTSEPADGNLEVEDAPEYEPCRYTLGAYRPFSLYPFIVRDISMWIVDSDEARGTVFKLFAEQGGGLLQQVQLLDQFTNKEGRQSLAFRFIFQSMERTLTDDEVNGIMEKVSVALGKAGFEVR